MNIELKNIVVYPKLSQETYAFSGTLYIDGVKVASVDNEGSGGCHNIRHFSLDFIPLLRAADTFVSNMPPHKYIDPTNTESVLPMDMDLFLSLKVDAFVQDKELKKFKKKLEKDQQYSVCYVDDTQYSCISWNRNGKKIPIKLLLATDTGTSAIRGKLKEIAQTLPTGHRILNTNIPVELYAK